MLIPYYRKKFHKDLKRVKGRKKNLAKLEEIMETLINEKPLNPRWLNHFLKGEYLDCQECHIEPDWLLIYLIEGKEIFFMRTGSHSDLFK